MQLATTRKNYLSTGKSFLIWCFTLAVCLLVVGFPLVALMATVGALLSVALHPVLPVSAVLLVAGGICAANILAVLVTAAVLTMKGIHPDEIIWLSWLNGKGNTLQTSTYAACPLTCEIKR
jgi:hypothetical protein